MQKADIKSFSLQELAADVVEMGEKPYRAKQIFIWLHQKQVAAFDEMSNISEEFQAICNERYYINTINVKKRLVSAQDGTVKYLYELRDGNMVETVLMRYRHGNSLCISTQAGCRMGCSFCASTIGGLVRNLTASEMLDQVYQTAKDSGEKIGSIVLMGIGEPLDNYGNVLRFLKLVSAPEGLNLSLRHVSLSTCGLVDGIDALGGERLALTLSISLHAPDDELRSRLMPVNERWPLSELISSCHRYFERTGRRISFEYALIEGENDAEQHARALAGLLRGMNCHVNLIPVNRVDGKRFRKSGEEVVRRFVSVLEQRHIPVTVRRRLGSDINAACGQLRRSEAAPKTAGMTSGNTDRRDPGGPASAQKQGV